MGSAWRCRENGGVKGSRKKGGREPAERRKQRGGSREEEAERRRRLRLRLISCLLIKAAYASIVR
jgi:hypothetical protein